MGTAGTAMATSVEDFSHLYRGHKSRESDKKNSEFWGEWSSPVVGTRTRCAFSKSNKELEFQDVPNISGSG